MNEVLSISAGTCASLSDNLQFVKEKRPCLTQAVDDLQHRVQAVSQGLCEEELFSVATEEGALVGRLLR
ncbi:hypothetical protein FHG87_017312 [Trinorchestia longiramus]|nr:hypothetical protein FHG87_017312 [Trinorchestia longiramus]